MQLFHVFAYIFLPSFPPSASISCTFHYQASTCRHPIGRILTFNMSIPSQSITSHHFRDIPDAKTTQQFFTSFPVSQCYPTHQSNHHPFCKFKSLHVFRFHCPIKSRCHTSKYFEHRLCKSFLSASVKTEAPLVVKRGRSSLIFPMHFSLLSWMPFLLHPLPQSCHLDNKTCRHILVYPPSLHSASAQLNLPQHILSCVQLTHLNS